MLKPDIHNAAQKFMDSREPKHQRQIAGNIFALCQDPAPPDSKGLKGAEKGQRRATAGEYRIIYYVAESENILHVTGIG